MTQTALEVDAIVDDAMTAAGDVAGVDFTSEFEALMDEERENREFLECEVTDELESTFSEASAEHQQLSRSHVCRLCFRWFGFTYAASHGHYSDTKGDFIRRQRSRNRRPSYLLCASCGDLPLLCHACFRMMHLNEDPQTVTNVDALQLEMKRRDGELSRSPSTLPDDGRDTNASPGSQVDAEVSSDHAPSGLPANLLKRSGLAILAIASTTERHTPSMVSDDKRHVALEMFTLDPRVAARQRSDVRRLFALSMQSFFEAADDSLHADLAPQISVAVSVLVEREAVRRREIAEIWSSERFSNCEFSDRGCDAALDGSEVPPCTITLSGVENESMHAVEPVENASFRSADTTRSGSPFSRSSPVAQVDAFVFAFIVETFEAHCAATLREETTARCDLVRRERSDRDSICAHVTAAHAVNTAVINAGSIVFLRESERLLQAMLDDHNEHSAAEYRRTIEKEVVHVLDGTSLYQSGALNADPVDDDGTPITLLWMQFHFRESVDRQAMWDTQLAEWLPLMRDAIWRAHQTERFLAMRALLQQHNFQANQLLRQFFVGHVTLVAEKMTDFLQIMADKAEHRTDQLSLQCLHATSRQEGIEEERLDRWRSKQQYSVSRLMAREATQRRLAASESLSLYLREMPNEEKLKRFSMEREYVVEYRSLIKQFVCDTRIDLPTLTKNCPHSFESAMGDWTRRLINREVSYFSFHREHGTITGACGIPLLDCFVWPFDPCRQMSLFWCPKFGPPKKKSILVQQGLVTRAVKTRQRVVRLPHSKSGHLSAHHGETEATTPRGAQASAASPLSQSKLIDDGPQPLLTALSVVSALLDVPSFASGRRFSCLSLVEDIVCWNTVCRQGQLLLGSYQDANAFDDLFAVFEDAVIDDAEVKWASMVSTRERERLAMLEQAFAGRGPPKVRSTPIAQSTRRPKKGRRRNISDSASSVVSADDATSAASTTETARSRQSTKSEGSALQGSSMDVPDDYFVAAAGASDLALAALPNYAMRESFFGTRFMFGTSIHLFERQWIPPLTVRQMSVPIDVSDSWGRAMERDDTESDRDDRIDHGEDQELDSDFSDDAVAASTRKRDAYLDTTEASRLRQDKKHVVKVQEQLETSQEAERRKNCSMRQFWAVVRERQEASADGKRVRAKPASQRKGATRTGARGVRSPVEPLNPALLEAAAQQGGPSSMMSTSSKRGPPSNRLGSHQRSPSPQGRPGRKNRSVSVVIADAFDMFDD